jgi:hypothetical protein
MHEAELKRRSIGALSSALPDEQAARFEAAAQRAQPGRSSRSRGRAVKPAIRKGDLRDEAPPPVLIHMFVTGASGVPLPRGRGPATAAISLILGQNAWPEMGSPVNVLLAVRVPGL